MSGHYGGVGASKAAELQISEVADQAPPTFEELYDATVDFVWRSARRLGVMPDAVDDVTQKVFLVAHRLLPEFERRASVKTWVFAILMRVVADHRRSLRRKSPHAADDAPIEPDQLADTGPGPEVLLSRAEASRVLDELLDALDEEKRDVFVLAEIEEMTAREISQILGITTKAVYTRLAVARVAFERAAERFRREQARRSP